VQSSSQIITTNKPTSSFLQTGLAFLSPNQQCRSTEGKIVRENCVCLFVELCETIQPNIWFKYSYLAEYSQPVFSTALLLINLLHCYKNNPSAAGLVPSITWSNSSHQRLFFRDLGRPGLTWTDLSGRICWLCKEQAPQ